MRSSGHTTRTDAGDTEKITYLVANYNCARYIKDCIQSVHDQTDTNWLCIVADDASTDHSIEVIRPYMNSKIRLIRILENRGYIQTLIRLIDESSTDIVGILDADDALYPEATDCILEAYRHNPDTGFIYSNCLRFDEELRIPTGKVGSSRLPPHKTLLQAGFVCAIKTFRKSYYEKTEGLDASLLYAEDRDLVYKLEEVTRPVFIDRPLYKYRVVPNSQSRDPMKREIGLRNHLQARRNALRRRHIEGVTRMYYDLKYWRRYARDMVRIRLADRAARIFQGRGFHG